MIDFDFFKEMSLTFSEQKSLLSSKKIERCIFFSIVCVMVALYFTINIIRDKFTTTDLISIMTVLLAYCGYNTRVNSKEKKQDLIDQK